LGEVLVALLAMHVGSVIGGAVAQGGLPDVRNLHPLGTVGVITLSVGIAGANVMLVLGLVLGVVFVVRRWPIIACAAHGICFAIMAFVVTNAWIVRD